MDFCLNTIWVLVAHWCSYEALDGKPLTWSKNAVTLYYENLMDFASETPLSGF